MQASEPDGEGQDELLEGLEDMDLQIEPSLEPEIHSNTGHVPAALTRTQGRRRAGFRGSKPARMTTAAMGATLQGPGKQEPNKTKLANQVASQAANCTGGQAERVVGRRKGPKVNGAAAIGKVKPPSEKRSQR